MGYTSIGMTVITELKFQRLGSPRSNNTTGDKYSSGPQREKHLIRTRGIEILQSQTLTTTRIEMRAPGYV